MGASECPRYRSRGRNPLEHCRSAQSALRPRRRTQFDHGAFDPRQPAMAAWAADFLLPGQIAAEHLVEEERQRKQRLLVGRDQIAAAAGQPGEKRPDLRGAQRRGLAQPMKAENARTQWTYTSSVLRL